MIRRIVLAAFLVAMQPTLGVSAEKDMSDAEFWARFKAEQDKERARKQAEIKKLGNKKYPDRTDSCWRTNRETGARFRIC